MQRRTLVAAALFALRPAGVTSVAFAQQMMAAAPGSAAGDALVERLRRGGLVMFFRHADTRGMPCDRSFRIGDRSGQRNISAAGRAQSARIGAALKALGVPIETPVLAGPVFRARDTAELAFGPSKVRVIDGLLADDYAGSRLDWVLSEHRRLFNDPVGRGANRVLVGHRTPAIMVLGPLVGGYAFPEGSALVIEPGSAGPRLLGVLAPAPVIGGGFHSC